MSYAASGSVHSHALHARTRARQRYGVGRNVVAELERLIRLGRSRRSLRQSRTRTLHELRLERRRFFVIYSTTTHCIVTFLQPPAGLRLFARARQAAETTPRCDACGCMLAVAGERRMCTVCGGLGG
ncbi:MAG: hypothetical protein KIS85_06370 [Anaerolineales bacterium]|nr:hypothetical protein [Anaerolineales bacterium]